MAHGRTVNDQKGEDSVIVNTVLKGTRQPSSHSSYLKQPFSRGNALARISKSQKSFRKGWKQRLQNQPKTYRRELKTDELAATLLEMELHTPVQTWMQMAQKELHAWHGKSAPQGLTNVLF